MIDSLPFAELAVPVLLGAIAGTVSMLLYARVSPQSRLQELKSQASELQQQMASFDGEFSGAMALAQQNLRLSFKRLGIALGPSLLSGVPVLACVPLVGNAYISYFVAVAVAAIVVKQWRRIT